MRLHKIVLLVTLCNTDTCKNILLFIANGFSVKQLLSLLMYKVILHINLALPRIMIDTFLIFSIDQHL